MARLAFSTKILLMSNSHPLIPGQDTYNRLSGRPTEIPSMSQDQEPNLTHLLLAAGAGSREAFRELYTRTSAQIFLRLMAEIDDKDVCVDLLKDVYVKAWELGHLYHSDSGDPVFWISMIARDLCLRRLQVAPMLRRQNVKQAALKKDRERPHKPSSEQNPAETVIRTHVSLCLPEISAMSSTVMRLSYRDGKGYSEIAAATDGSEDDLRKDLTRTISRINDRLARCGIQVDDENGRRDGHRTR